MTAFLAVDVETANPDLASICQIGVVHFGADGPESRWQTLIDPNDYFDPLHVEIHGITESMVASAPTFADVYDELASLLQGRISVCHTHFDRVALDRLCEQYDLSPITCTWLDSARVARRAWPDRYARAGYSLGNIAADLRIEYRAHEAVEDAWAAGNVLNDLTYRQLNAALVSDASHFLCESLIASAKGKTQVAYSLLRKPLKENLLLLEWLAGSPDDSLELFHGESISRYVVNQLPKKKRCEILRRASEAVNVPGVDADLLWVVRYAK